MKRMTASVLACLMILACTCGTAGATFVDGTADAMPDVGLIDESAVVRSSLYLSKYNIGMDAGYSSGELRINYKVAASTWTTSVGVSQIKIYQANGTLVTTIYGSASNGLLCTDGSTEHSGTYSYYARSGVLYYAVVAAYATNDSGSDCKLVTTNYVVAP